MTPFVLKVIVIFCGIAMYPSLRVTWSELTTLEPSTFIIPFVAVFLIWVFTPVTIS